MKRSLVLLAVLALLSAPAPAQAPATTKDALIARAKALELPTLYEPPPGDALSHHTAGFAKVMCSAVFVTGLDPDFAAENVGYFTGPYPERAKVGKPVVDRAASEVRITMPNGVTRVARYVGDQGCVTLPEGETALHYAPRKIEKRLPDPQATEWPLGEALPRDPLPPGPDAAGLKRAVDAAFEPATSMTAAFVVTWKGRLVAERYGSGITATTPLESWSMGKSLTATLMGILIKEGTYDLWQTRAHPRMARSGGPAGQDPHRRPAAHVQRDQDPGAAGSRPRSAAGPIPTTSSSTRAASTPSAMRPPVRSSGRPIRLGAIATPIPSSSTTSFASRSRNAVSTTLPSRNGRSSTSSASARWSWRPTPTGTS